MNVHSHALLVTSVTIASLIGPAHAEESCTGLRQLASAAMETLPDGTVYVPVLIKDRSLNFLLETESFGSVISATSAATLTLPQEHIAASNLQMYGDRLQEFATTDAFRLGGMAGKVGFAVAPDSDFKSGISGIFAADFLRHFDVEFDFAKSRVNLFSPDHCEGGVVYWTQSGGTRVPMKLTPFGQIRVDAALEGEPISTEIATGLAKSTMQIAEDETKFGQQNDWKVINGRGTHYNARTVYEHTFKSLNFGGIEVNNVNLTINSGGTPYFGAGLYLGMDILRQLHLYAAYKERNLYASAATAGAAPLAQAMPHQPAPSTPPAPTAR
jgi:hypothetical protein